MPDRLDPKLDLVLERVVDVRPELVWKAWTTPEHLKRWFCPRPWSVSECELDLRPGGMFRPVMRSPEGQDMPSNVGCFLEVVENRRLVWTTALLPGYRPAPPAPEDLHFTAVITIEPHGSGTKYRAVAMHSAEHGARKHADMGFHQGWGKALDQLVELAKTL